MTPAPTPQPAHDHGAAGFCGNHAQPPDGQTETVARVLREHPRCRCCEGCQTCPSIDVPIDQHQAAAVVAALDDESARLRAAVERLREWQREVCDVGFGYDADEPGAADEVLTYLPAWKGEALGVEADLAAARAALDRVRAVVASPGDLMWLNLSRLSRRSQAAYRSGWEAAGREYRRAALDPEEPR